MLPREDGLVYATSEKRKLSACSSLSPKIAGLRSLPSHKCKKSLSLFDRYKKQVKRYADMAKAASHPPVPVEETSQGENGSKHELTYPHVWVAKQPHTLSPMQGIQEESNDREWFPDNSKFWPQTQLVEWYHHQLCPEYPKATLTVPSIRTVWYITWTTPYAPKGSVLLPDFTWKNHWILVPTVDCPQPSVKVYDSLFCGQISPNIQKQTAAVLHTEVAEIKFLANHMKIAW